MTAYIDLDEIKQHLNIDLDYHDEDEYLLRRADAAIRMIENRIDQPIDNFVYDGELDAPLVDAALLLIGTRYNYRESIAVVNTVQIQHGVEDLIRPYIKLHRDENCSCK